MAASRITPGETIYTSRPRQRMQGPVADGVPALRARLDRAHDVAVAGQFIEALLKRGLSLESIYMELLTPAARLLGEWWKQDLRNFAQVTSGLCRMHQLLHEFSHAFMDERPAQQAGRRVLLSSSKHDNE